MVVQSNFENFQLDINSTSDPASLGTLEFQNATKTNKPKFPEGTLIFCRVLKAERMGRVELTCIDPLEKKSWNSGEATYSELKGGMMKDFPVNFCRELLKS